MGPIIRNVRGNNGRKQIKKRASEVFDPEDVLAPRDKPWPQIDCYEENGVMVKVMQQAWLLGAKSDHRVRPPRKKR